MKGHQRVEEAMSKALIRYCPRKGCGQQFLKDIGCNKMTCPCGTKICYICRKEIQGYEHFYTTPHCDHKNCGKCLLYMDTEEIDERAMKEAKSKAEEAVRNKSATHPNNQVMDLAQLEDDPNNQTIDLTQPEDVPENRPTIRMAPDYPSVWFEEKKECYHFKSPGGCRFGRKCHYVHVAPRFGRIVNDRENLRRFQPRYNNHDVYSVCQPDREGKDVYTAAIFDRYSRTFVKSELGSFEVEGNGNYWYNNRGDAILAAENGLIVLQNKDNLPYAVRGGLLGFPSHN